MSPQQRAQQVRDAYESLQSRPGEWVPLADLREQLGGMSRADVDATLKELATTPGVQVIPWDNRNALGKRDHDAALRFGGEANHAIRFEPDASGGQAATARTEPEPIRARAMEALERAGARNGETMGIEQLRAAMGGTRAEQDAVLNQLNDERMINMMPQSNQKIMTAERRAAAVRRGGEDKTLVMLGSAAAPGRAAQRQSAPQGSDSDAKRQRLAALVQAAATSGNTRESIRLRDQADELRREIADDDATGKVDQPREVTRAEVMDVYSRLAAKPGALVSLVKIRGHLPHLRHGELTAVLKQMDRDRLIQLDPDPNRKALPPEAHEAAIVIGGEPKHFISVIGGTEGRAAQRLRR